MEKLRLGIIGPGRIVRRVMTDIPRCEKVELWAIASRDIERAKAAAEEYGARKYFGSYEEMAECPEIDIVYIATPNNCHLEQALLMLNHKKHVICEKPLAMNGDEARRMVSCARENGVFLMEAMWTRVMPAMQKLLSLVKSGEIGEVNQIFGCFGCSFGYDPESRFFMPELGGGSLLDLGVYPLMAVTGFLGYKPVRVSPSAKLAPSGVDARMSLTLDYENGATAQIFSSCDAESRSELILFGTKGSVYATDFWHMESFTLRKSGEADKVYAFKKEHEGHRHEFDHAAECIMKGLTESPELTLDESIAISDIMTNARHECGIFYPGEKTV